MSQEDGRFGIEREKASRMPETLAEYTAQNPFVKAACELAKKAHYGQKRDEGSPYFSHCEAVAEIIYREWGITNYPEMVAAAYLHDTVEDTSESDNPVTLDYIRSVFGEKVAFFVDGVSKFKSDKNLSKEQANRETIRKVFGHSTISPEVAVLKLADRTHNMRTMGAVSAEKQARKALETLSYAKLAESLGMWKVMIELEDLSLMYTNPEEYVKFSKILENDPRNTQMFRAYMTSRLEQIALGSGVRANINVLVNGKARLRHKLLREHRFTKINDAVSFRVVVDDSQGRQFARNDCMKILGSIWDELGDLDDARRFDNFFTKRTDNLYSAFHVTLNFPFGSEESSVEVAITTKSKEEFNNWGVVSLIRSGVRDLGEYSLKLIFTATGEVKFFKPEATGLDFAYSIDRHLGAQATGMLIDGKWMPISSVIPNTSTVEILAGKPRIAPEADAVNYVQKPARRLILEQIAEEKDHLVVRQGKEMIKDVLAKRGILDLYTLIEYKKTADATVAMLRRLGCKRYVSNLYRAIGLGQLGIEELESALDAAGITRESLKLNSIHIEGNDNKNLLGFMGRTIGKYGGNIAPMKNIPDERGGKRTFKAFFLVEELPQANIKKLQIALLKNPAIKKVEIV